MSAVVEVQHLRKTYGGVLAVDDLSMEVEQGEIFGLLGPNGAGKTTTVECMEGLRHPDSGRIRVLGMDPSRQPRELRRRIGCQLQEAALPDRIRVWEALDLFAALAPRADPWRTVLERWGLEGRGGAAFSSLSGGEQQRLFIALALINQPQVVFLDELTQGLDPAARRVAWDLVRSVRDRGSTVVLVTHFMEEAQQLCDRVAVVHHGRVAAVDTPQELINRFGGGVRVVFSVPPGQEVDWLRRVPHASAFARHGPRIEVSGDGPVLAHVGAALIAHGLEPADLRLEQPSLEDVFLGITRAPGGDGGEG
ncbi:MAG: ABC transporter ATP-binding protein [Candidatus Dormibacteria bacterium]|jgi:ABC-2 type transport system ATP-binding protein